MPERLRSISQARQTLPRLSQAVGQRMDRYVITHQGQPQSVLLGYQDYQSMKAATELVQRPDLVEDIRAGLKELAKGKRLTPDQARKRLRAMNTLATDLGVDAQTIVGFVRRAGTTRTSRTASRVTARDTGG